MTMNSPYNIEAALLGVTLKWGKEAAALLLPHLTPDKFVFNFDGTFGSGHSEIWQAISEVFLTDKTSPTYLVVSHKTRGIYESYLKELVNRVESRYSIFSFDPHQAQYFADVVDKQGIVYNISHAGKSVAASTADIDAFMNTLNTIRDVDVWATEQLDVFRHTLSTKSEGYHHVSHHIDAVKERWDRQFRGDEISLLPNGLPSLLGANLFPLRRMAVIHGLSSSGKSTLVFQVNLGTAIGLYLNDVKGCVAINSLEMEAEALVERMVSILARVDVSRFMGGTITKAEMNQLFDWADFVGKLPIFVDDTNFITTTAMEYRAKGLHVSEYGPVLQISSDYGELFKDDDKASEELRMSKVFREQFNLSRLIGASVVAISQSTVDRAASGKSQIAGPDGTRYSRSILQATDILAELWNPPQMEAAGRTVVGPEGYSTAHPWLFIQKYRNAKTGLAVPLGWDAPTTTFFDLSMAQTPGHETIFDHLEAAMVKAGMKTAPVTATW